MIEFADYSGYITVSVFSRVRSKQALRALAEEVEAAAIIMFPNSAVCVTKTQKMAGMHLVEFEVEVSAK